MTNSKINNKQTEHRFKRVPMPDKPEKGVAKNIMKWVVWGSDENYYKWNK